MEWRGAHSGAALREPFMYVHAMRCILIHTPRVAVPRSAAPLRLQPFARPGTLANAGRPAHVKAFQPTMKSLRRSTAMPREAKAMHSFGAGVTQEPNGYMGAQRSHPALPRCRKHSAKGFHMGGTIRTVLWLMSRSAPPCPRPFPHDLQLRTICALAADESNEDLLLAQ